MSLPDKDQIEAKAHLLPFLRAAMRAIESGQFEQAEGLLDNLLRMEPERRANAAIEHERIVAPVFIIGLPRTGTTGSP